MIRSYAPRDRDPDMGAFQALRRTLQLAPALRAGLAGTLALAMAGAIGRVVVPVTMQVVIDRHILASGSVDLDAVVRLGALALGVLLGTAVANRSAQLRMSAAAAAGLSELQVMTFAHLHRLSTLHVQSERRGALVARVTSDVQEIQQFISWGGVNLLLSTLRIVLVVGLMLYYRWELALVVVALTAGYGFVLRWFQRLLQRAYDRVRLRVADSMAAIGEAIAGLPTVRAYGAEDRTRARLRTRLAAQFSAEYRTHRSAAALFSSAEIFSATVTVVVLLVGLFVIDGVSAGTLVAFLFLVNQFIEPVQTLVETLDQAQVAASGVRRILRVLDVPPDLDDRDEGVDLPSGALAVEVRGVRFAYTRGGDVLSDIDVVIPAGSRTAIVGETGSGKTTFAKLLVRLLRPAAGRILIGGVPLDDVRPTALRSHLAFVPQEGFLFDATIADNVRYGRPEADDDQVREAFKELGLDGWLATLPADIDSVVGQRGGQLSAGERQLVALVRAWIADPSVLVLDEATSAVDPALDVQLRQAIERLTTGRTSITIAHRLATAESADLVIVFDRGRIAAQGTHAQLLRDSVVYRRLHADWAAGTSLDAELASRAHGPPEAEASPSDSVGVGGDHQG
ncbi:MAG TPA: ABC transporter ATP-binding protein [Euzebyales bacterium]|nr:ABC transporter ATP-binding protein [Euzebyales bacterium]